MGRPINKKYFGNRNTTPVVGKGGEGVASYTSVVAGSGWTSAPTITVDAPSGVDGVTATIRPHYKALSFATSANGTGYAVGDILEVTTGTAATKARAPVASILTIGTPNINNGGTNYDVDGAVGDRVTFTHPNLSQALVVEITAVNVASATTIEVVTPGIWIGTGAAPTSTVGWTATTSDGPTDNNGSGLVLDGLVWGVYSFGTVSVAGDYTVFPSTGASGALTSVSPATGTGAKADIVMGLLSIEVLTSGSGYLDSRDASLIFSNAQGADAIAVLTAARENAIIIHANVGNGVELGDVVKQTNDRRYRVKTEYATKKCQLVASDSLNYNSDTNIGEAYIQATDDNGNTYFVTRLTSRVATLEQWTQDGSNAWLFADGARAKWTFGATSPSVVQIENA